MLGPIKAFEGDEPVDLGGPTQRRLLATLVAYEGEAVPVPDLLDALWGDEPPPSGPATIQSYVSRLRSALGREAIETTSAGYRLGVGKVGVDAQGFLTAYAGLPSEPETRLEAIEEALSMWKGPPFEGFDHVDFASRRLIETRLDLQEARAALLSRAGRTSEAIGSLEKVIADEPFRESAWIVLGQALAASGRHADAIRALERYRRNLSDIGLEPSAGFRSAESELFSAELEISSEKPLPSPVSSFHGRAQEKMRLSSMIDEHRLVTVVGPGGMGKTRLALETAASMDRRPWLARLENVRDESKVTSLVLSTLGAESRGDPIISVVEALRRSPGLLILDNCEHVIDASAKLSDAILRETSSSVLATSREPLNVPGESLLHLGSMDEASATDLYFDRASSVDEDFSADPAQVEALCQKLDFMPLAIEIAASRSRALSPEAILERLDRRYGLLDKGLRGERRRHETLDAMVDWSYSLLPNATRRVFERLSVFMGDFDLEAATHVAGLEDVKADEVPAHVADLVERSMLEPVDAGGSYRMLQAFKSFASDRLFASGSSTEARDRHADHYVSVARRIGEGIMSSEETEWVRRANKATEDLGAALEWLVEREDLDATEAILEGLFQWFYHRQPPAILDWGEKVLDVAAGHRAHSIAGAWAAAAALKKGDVTEALRVAQTATSQEVPTSALAWFMAGDVACYVGDFERSVAFYEETLRRARDTNDDVAVVDALSRLMLSMVRNRSLFDQAMARTDELVDLLGHIEAPPVGLTPTSPWVRPTPARTSKSRGET